MNKNVHLAFIGICCIPLLMSVAMISKVGLHPLIVGCFILNAGAIYFNMIAYGSK